MLREFICEYRDFIDINREDKDSRTALHHVYMQRNTSKLALLYTIFRDKFDLTVEDYEKKTPISYMLVPGNNKEKD